MTRSGFYLSNDGRQRRGSISKCCHGCDILFHIHINPAFYQFLSCKRYGESRENYSPAHLILSIFSSLQTDRTQLAYVLSLVRVLHLTTALLGSKFPRLTSADAPLFRAIIYCVCVISSPQYVNRIRFVSHFECVRRVCLSLTTIQV